MIKTKVASSMVFLITAGTMLTGQVSAMGAGITTVTKVATTANVVAGSDVTQTLSNSVTTANVLAGADNTQDLSFSLVTSNKLAGADNTQSAILTNSIPNSNGIAQVDHLTLSGVIDNNDLIEFTSNSLGTISSSVPSSSFADALSQLVSDIQGNPLYPIADFTVSYSATDTAMVITAKFPNGTQNTFSTTMIDTNSDSSPLSQITSIVQGSGQVAKVDTITLSGAIDEGDKFTFSFDGGAVNTVTYTATGSDTTSDVATGLNNAIVNSSNYATSLFSSSVSGSVITLTGRIPGVSFATGVSATNRAAQAQVSRIDVTGAIDAGDVFNVHLVNSSGATSTGSYTATGSDTPSSVATGLNSAIYSILGSGGFGFSNSLSGSQIDLTATQAGVGFSGTVSASNAPAVAQVSSVSVSGAVELGDVFTVTMPSLTQVQYVATGSTTTASVATGLFNAITGHANYSSESVSAAVSGSNVILTAKVAGTPFNVSSSASNRAAVAQVDTLTFSSITSGDTVSLDIGGTIYSYSVQVGNTANNIVSGLTSAINGDASSVVTASGTSTLILTSKTPGTSFTVTSSVIVTGVVDKTVKFKSGWSVFSTPKKLAGISFSNGNAAGLSFYKLEGGVWSGVTVAPTTANITPLEGFLVYNANGTDIDAYLSYADNLTPAQKIYQKTLSAGWNILGVTTTSSPFATIGSSATATVDFTNGNAKTNTVNSTYGSVNGSSVVNNAELGEAYAVFMSQAGIYGGSQ